MDLQLPCQRRAPFVAMPQAVEKAPDCGRRSRIVDYWRRGSGCGAHAARPHDAPGIAAMAIARRPRRVSDP
jgi:hypothetical protein